MPTDRNKQQAKRIEDVLARMGLQITAIPATRETLSAARQLYDLRQGRLIYLITQNVEEQKTRSEYTTQ